jgi:hypothetical protein
LNWGAGQDDGDLTFYFAHVMRELVDVHFPQAEKIRVVLDNLNMHNPASS